MIARVVFLSLFLVSGCASFSYDGLAEHDHFDAAGSFSSAAGNLHKSSKVAKAKRLHWEAYPECAICGVKSNIVNGHRNDVHHIIPISEGIQISKPELAWDPDNLITLCRVDHFRDGHRGNWSKHNPNIRAAADELKRVGDWWREVGWTNTSRGAEAPL